MGGRVIADHLKDPGTGERSERIAGASQYGDEHELARLGPIGELGGRDLLADAD